MKQTLIGVIQQVPPKNFVDIGYIIVFSDICDAVKNMQGYVDPVFIEMKILELERAGQLKVVKQDDLIIGVIL